MSFNDEAKVITFPELDPALEWCEARLIVKYGLEHELPRLVSLSEHQFCKDLKKTDVAYLESLVERERFNSSDLIIQKGDAADKLYFLMRGEVSVLIYLPNGQPKRLSTLSAGMGFGELAIVDGGVRSADVRADTPVECWTLTKKAFECLEKTHAQLKIGLLQNLLRTTAQIAGRLTREVMALEE